MRVRYAEGGLCQLTLLRCSSRSHLLVVLCPLPLSAAAVPQPIVPTLFAQSGVCKGWIYSGTCRIACTCAAATAKRPPLPLFLFIFCLCRTFSRSLVFVVFDVLSHDTYSSPFSLLAVFPLYAGVYNGGYVFALFGLVILLSLPMYGMLFDRMGSKARKVKLLFIPQALCLTGVSLAMVRVRQISTLALVPRVCNNSCHVLLPLTSVTHPALSLAHSASLLLFPRALSLPVSLPACRFRSAGARTS